MKVSAKSIKVEGILEYVEAALISPHIGYELKFRKRDEFGSELIITLTHHQLRRMFEDLKLGDR